MINQLIQLIRLFVQNFTEFYYSKQNSVKLRKINWINQISQLKMNRLIQLIGLIDY